MTISETHATPEAGTKHLVDLLLEVLPSDGSTMGNQAVREAMSRSAERQISEEEYEEVKTRALALRLVVKGRGRGGTLSLTKSHTNRSESSTTSIAAEELYSPLKPSQEDTECGTDQSLVDSIGSRERTRTLYYGDNLNTLKAISSNTIDLIYLDPPYNSKRVYNCSFGGNAQAKAFDDNWRWDHDQDAWMNAIKENSKELWGYLDALLKIFRRRDGLPAYLTAMSVRLVEMHRVLNEEGTIYLHVDQTASHYLKIAMDQIFGGDNFRNEIIWSYKSGGASKKNFAKKHDTILVYGKSPRTRFNPQVEKSYNRGFKPYRFKGVEEYMDEEGKWYTLVNMRDVWDIDMVGRTSKERLGYPTQKPIALLERIIKASSKPGDIVLDPYMGSGTTIEVAETLGRSWIGLDVTHHAVACTTARLTERCGLDESEFEIIGVPEDIEAANHLWDIDRTQFEAWAVLGVHAIPHQTKDERIIGLRPFSDIRESRIIESKAVYIVSKQKLPTVNDVDKLRLLIKEHEGEIGFLISIDECSEEVRNALDAAGTLAQNNGKSYSARLQHISVNDIIENPASARRFFCIERNRDHGRVERTEQTGLFTHVE